MNGISELRNVLKKLLYPNSSGELLMREKKESGTLKKVKLTGLDASGITIKADQEQYQIFKENCASCLCDYIVLTTWQDKNVAVFIELKSTVPESDHKAKHPTIQPDGQYEHYVVQLSGGSCLFSYLHNVLKMFKGCTAFQKYQHKYCVLYEKFQIPKTSLSLPISPTKGGAKLPSSNPATKAKMVRVQNDCEISLEELLK